MLNFAAASVSASGNANVAIKMLIVNPIPPSVPAESACPGLAPPGSGAPVIFVRIRTLP